MAKAKPSGQPESELVRIWHKARDEGIWLQIVDGTPGACMAAAGSLPELKSFGAKTERWALWKIRRNKLGLGDCLALSSVPGTGKTPEAACRSAIRTLKRILKSKDRPR